GLPVAVRSRGGMPDGKTEIYVADTLGELELWYRLAPVVFVGGSLVPHGGQNPIEAVKLGAAVLHGRDTWNFAEIYDTLDHAQGAIEVEDAEDLARRIHGWLTRPDERGKAVVAARTTLTQLSGALERT